MGPSGRKVLNYLTEPREILRRRQGAQRQGCCEDGSREEGGHHWLCLEGRTMSRGVQAAREAGKGKSAIPLEPLEGLNPTDLQVTN
jgi:hypothetical protein